MPGRRQAAAGCALRSAIPEQALTWTGALVFFGAFQQMQKENGSTGLGLFIAQRIVSAIGAP